MFHFGYFLVDFSRKNSFDFGETSRESEFVVLKERKLVSTSLVYQGLTRFAFLLESCPPGSALDAHLLAAVLDLVRKLYFFENNINKNVILASFNSCFQGGTPSRMFIFCPLLQQRPLAHLDEIEFTSV